MTSAFFDCGRYRFRLQRKDSGKPARPLVMGILNATPDSFSDGGKFQNLDHAVAHAEAMIESGVDIIDIGGESSRPGSAPVSLQDELDRVIPLVYALRDCGRAISVDTYKPEVMKEAILAGADMINDIRGFSTEASRFAVQQADVGLCIMHMQNNPETMQDAPHYSNVIDEVASFLMESSDAFVKLGVDRNRMCIDPGFGFGKSLEHNLTLIRQLRELQNRISLPVLVGLSRKSMIGAITDKAVEHRLAGSLAAALACAREGAQIVRVHDVAETVDALKVWDAIYAA
ncbi:dihydropteroate synthase [Undibacterium cyanobacteriorum]|uniref:Dihydropteroate synthase n=1 Tax=Undibacterium cyanobacteriorum TaxID=3073561 RepID=A0ABY9RCS6_9BURK|nr:dihydropteroate synthase [Undibacterium sp. 20NA77.5]WMW79038.1 dihydropteroate synthase [Undibacterium sp. 20NA77.5]